ncbi:MAG: protein-(glutamine-N5) methyltransferase, release factor-specific [Proteobacteria bacterium]|nr:MAG: protein-(glutamine-N5) methyltransferase, release factor-specific [Pseudomonadota bacterium]
MRIDQALRSATKVLTGYSDSPRLDSEILLSHLLNKPRSYLYAWPEVELDSSLLEAFNAAVELRKTEYPIAYITGYQEFWSLQIGVTENVLIPRADTELLVETSLAKLQEVDTPSILELGTGSGAIALALASERPDAKVLAVDNSCSALDVAKHNQQSLHIHNVQFMLSNWYESLPRARYDLIVSNPPYIDPADKHMTTGIRFEPRQALCADHQGLADLVYIIHHAQNYLKPDGWILLEHGFDQGSLVTKQLQQAGFQHAHCLKDLAGNDRISLAKHMPTQSIPTLSSRRSNRPV